MRLKYKLIPLTKELKLAYNVKNRFFRNILLKDGESVRKRQYNIIMHNHISARLEESYLSTKSRRIEYRYPFLDVKLIEYYFSLPAKFKYNNGYGRWIFRKVMEEILPQEILWEKSNLGTVIPYVHYLIIKDESIIRDIIEDGKNNNFHFFNYKKLHWILDQLKERDFHRNMNFSGRNFLNSISILILQKWQREGKIDIGIKC